MPLCVLSPELHYCMCLQCGTAVTVKVLFPSPLALTLTCSSLQYLPNFPVMFFIFYTRFCIVFIPVLVLLLSMMTKVNWCDRPGEWCGVEWSGLYFPDNLVRVAEDLPIM